MPLWGKVKEGIWKKEAKTEECGEKKIFLNTTKNLHIGRETNHMYIKKKERNHLQLMNKRHKKDIILAPFPSTTIASSRIKSGSLEFIMTSNQKALAILKMYVLLQFYATLKLLKNVINNRFQNTLIFSLIRHRSLYVSCLKSYHYFWLSNLI